MSKTQGNFKLTVKGEFTDSQIIVTLGENGTGQTTFISMLAGLLKPDSKDDTDVEMPEFNASYKPQKTSPKFPSLFDICCVPKIVIHIHPQFNTDVMKPLQIGALMDEEVVNLSGRELQRVALCLCTITRMEMTYCLLDDLSVAKQEEAMAKAIYLLRHALCFFLNSSGQFAI